MKRNILFTLLLVFTTSGCYADSGLRASLVIPIPISSYSTADIHISIPLSPYHGYRHHHRHGHDLFFDNTFGAYVLINFPGLYFYNDHYMRFHQGKWLVTRHLRQPWRHAHSHEIPWKLKQAKRHHNKQYAKTYVKKHGHYQRYNDNGWQWKERAIERHRHYDDSYDRQHDRKRDQVKKHKRHNDYYEDRRSNKQYSKKHHRYDKNDDGDWIRKERAIEKHRHNDKNYGNRHEGTKHGKRHRVSDEWQRTERGTSKIRAVRKYEPSGNANRVRIAEKGESRVLKRYKDKRY